MTVCCLWPLLLEAKLTAPITGPFTKSDFLRDINHWTGGSGPKSYLVERTWYRQQKPYDLPLYFDSTTRTGKSRYVSTGPRGNWSGSSIEALAKVARDQATRGDIYNQAYARFRDKMGEAVELGVATAEGREAMSMVTRRLLQLGNFTRHLATGRFGLAASDLGIEWSGTSKRFINPRLPRRFDPKPTRGRETARSFSSLYLEAHFGWRPLVKDVHDGLRVLDNPMAPQRVRASATGPYSSPSNFTRVTQDASWKYHESQIIDFKQTVTLQADIIIVNPNLAMMQQFGVANPVSIAWELVPFSFVLDWFVNVGDYLGSLTDFAGISLKNAQMTTFTRSSGVGYKYSIPFRPTSDNTVAEDWTCQGAHCHRRTGLGSGPSIRLRNSKPWGIARGLAAASLLMQRFPRREIDRNALSIAKKRTAFRSNVFPQFYGKYF